jgi:hypothetical protein
MTKVAYLFPALLAGCAGTVQQLPPGPPPISAIAATWASLNSSGVPPVAMLNIGVTLDDQGCYSWFDQQVAAGQQNTFAQSTLGLGGGGAAIAGGPAGLAAAGAMGLASGLLGAAQANSPTGTDPIAALGLTVRQRQTWLAALPVPLSHDVAWSYLNTYHQFCSLSGIRLAIAQAAMTSPVMVIPAPVPVVTPVSSTPTPVVIPAPRPAPAPPPPTPIPTPPPVSVPPPLPPSSGPDGPIVTPNFRGQVAVPPRVCVGCR